MDAGTVATMIAAIATTASAGIIAWQAVETRKSAEAANRAATAGEAAVEVANASLAISQAQSHQAQFTALEAIRSRLEVTGPSVTMALTSKGPVGYVIGASSSEDRYEPIDVGTLLQVPQEQSKWLYAVYRVRLTNSAPRPVTTYVYPKLFSTFGSSLGLMNGMDTVLIPANDDVSGFMAVGTMVERWVHGAENDRQGHAICGEGGWGTALETRQGIVLSQQVKILGSIIRPQPFGRAGEWELQGVGPDINYSSRLDVRKVERSYYIDEDRPLPELDLIGSPPDTR
jgi:hypothetical protein